MPELTILNKPINHKCELIGQVRLGLLLIDVYSWGLLVLSGPQHGHRPHLQGDHLITNDLKVFPRGDMKTSKRLNILVKQLREDVAFVKEVASFLGLTPPFTKKQFRELNSIIKQGKDAFNAFKSKASASAPETGDGSAQQ